MLTAARRMATKTVHNEMTWRDESMLVECVGDRDNSNVVLDIDDRLWNSQEEFQWGERYL